MRVKPKQVLLEARGKRGRFLRSTALSLVSALAIGGAFTTPLLAQTADPLTQSMQSDPNAPMLLQADQLIYDIDNNTVTAAGAVSVDYDGTRLLSDKLVYKQLTNRLVAIGNVEVLQPDGTRTFADEIDVTDDFRDGFVNSLRVVTPERTNFAAESATRENGTIMTFNNGVYTACNACKEKQGKNPFWQIKAKKVIWNGETKTMRFENARFEFLGIPIAYLPYFVTADSSVKRKTGFLLPSIESAPQFGFGLRVPYFVNLAPDRDISLAATGYTKQGFLAEAEYRQVFESGTFTLKAAGIHQFSPKAFNAGTIDSSVVNRGMIGTTGHFKINPRWAFGWNGMLQSDANFSNTYSIRGFSGSTVENKIYLTGLGSRSYFDLRAIYYDKQVASSTDTSERKQGIVLPSLDYNYIVDGPVAGGQLSFDFNTRGIVRRDQDSTPLASNYKTPGADANSWRLSAQTEWRKTFITSSGLVITPILHAQGETSIVDDNTGGANLSASGASFNGSGTSFRGMVTAGLELRYPILFSTSSATHVLEPIAQVFARPSETLFGVLPNEDAQSLVFDGASLFQRDKFSGYDRMEGGTRANVGIRYTGSFANGWGVNAVAGQSFHLAGVNSYGQADTANAGSDSGLETARSDYVAALNLTDGKGMNFNVGTRLDESTFEVRRAEANVSLSYARINMTAGYAFIDAQPTYGFQNDRHEANAAISYKLDANWSVFGTVTYDIAGNDVDKYSFGTGYENDCFIIRANYAEDRTTTGAIKRNYGVFISMRTLGDFGNNPDQFGNGFN